jgi:hypothetical protein
MVTKVVTFGETMMRLSPPGYQRFTGALLRCDLAEADKRSGLAGEFRGAGGLCRRLPHERPGRSMHPVLRQYGVGVTRLCGR